MSNEEIEGTEEYLLSNMLGGRITLRGKVYHQVSEYWWAVHKPDSVNQDVEIWRNKGYNACSRYKVVRSGASWNNGPNDMRCYSVYASYKGDSQ